MEELIKLIEEERKVFKQRDHFYSQADTKYKCIHRLHWARHQQPTLHKLYELEKAIEQRAKLLFEENKDNPKFLAQLIAIYKSRLNQVIYFLSREKISWQKICRNIQKELGDNIEEYRQELNVLKIREIEIERNALKTY